ncbi:MAG: hypothetical protein M1833_001467 [Piccolia ochrophora]|nr:MAG: hypothetical protein M1833_001467 [Piccolia ochrophora]
MMLSLNRWLLLLCLSALWAICFAEPKAKRFGLKQPFEGLSIGVWPEAPIQGNLPYEELSARLIRQADGLEVLQTSNALEIFESLPTSDPTTKKVDFPAALQAVKVDCNSSVFIDSDFVGSVASVVYESFESWEGAHALQGVLYNANDQTVISFRLVAQDAATSTISNATAPTNSSTLTATDELCPLIPDLSTGDVDEDEVGYSGDSPGRRRRWVNFRTRRLEERAPAPPPTKIGKCEMGKDMPNLPTYPHAGEVAGNPDSKINAAIPKWFVLQKNTNGVCAVPSLKLDSNKGVKNVADLSTDHVWEKSFMKYFLQTKIKADNDAATDRLTCAQFKQLFLAPGKDGAKLIQNLWNHIPGYLHPEFAGVQASLNTAKGYIFHTAPLAQNAQFFTDMKANTLTDWKQRVALLHNVAISIQFLKHEKVWSQFATTNKRMYRVFKYIDGKLGSDAALNALNARFAEAYRTWVQDFMQDRAEEAYQWTQAEVARLQGMRNTMSPVEAAQLATALNAYTNSGPARQDSFRIQGPYTWTGGPLPI